MQANQRVTRDRYGQLLAEILSTAGGYARSILRNKEDADDAVQQAAMRRLEHIATYDPQRSLKAWWFTILRNCCMDVLRAKQSRGKIQMPAMPPASRSSSLEDWEELAVAMERLSHDHAEILRLRGGLSADRHPG